MLWISTASRRLFAVRGLRCFTPFFPLLGHLLGRERIHLLEHLLQNVGRGGRGKLAGVHLSHELFPEFCDE